MDANGLNAFQRKIVSTIGTAMRSLEPLYHEREKILAQLQYAANSVEPALRKMPDIARHIINATSPMLKQFKQWERLQNSFMPALKHIAEELPKLPDRQRRALDVLAEDGWYFDPEWSFRALFEIAGIFEAREFEAARQMLCEHFDSRLCQVEAYLGHHFPERKKVLAAAFRAHQSGDYALSVPVFLAQADGICSQCVGTQLYARINRVPKLAASLQIKGLSPFWASLFHPLIVPMPISASTKERAGRRGILNRHAILHGEVADYDTRTNSSRALSLLIYVSWILGEVYKHRCSNKKDASGGKRELPGAVP